MNFKQALSLLKKNQLVFSSLVLILIYYLPYFVLGEKARITIHDNLDSNVTWVKLLIDNNAVFVPPSTIIKPFLDGVPVYSVYPTYDIPILVFKLFGIYSGYVINRLLISCIGFVGMYLLLKKHFLPGTGDIRVVISIALVFSLLPFWSFTASIQGIPFVLFAFLNFRNYENKWYNWLIILVFGFYSSLFLAGVFFLITQTIIFLYDIWAKKKINWLFLGGIAFLSLCYVVSHFPLFYSILVDGFVPHRTEHSSTPIGLWRATYLSLRIFIFGHYHFHSIHTLLLLPASLILLLKHNSFSKKIKLIFIYLIVSSTFYGFINFGLVIPLKEKIQEFIPINISRFISLNPAFWYIFFAATLAYLANQWKYGKKIINLLLLTQLVYVGYHHEIWQNRDDPTYEQFYAEETFQQIKDSIDRPVDSYKVISVGLHPSIAQYNGFYTLDGYSAYYPLAYKTKFHEIIKQELERDESLKNYFVNWGSRCYAFSSELGKDFISNKRAPVERLLYDFDYLYEMGGEYVISNVYIDESNNPNLKLLETFSPAPGDYWTIYLYAIQTD